ncbi:hypothetical protein DFH07DRAFT_860944 [Mycena maculata]|uniref:C2H2-type domain-containing protein n=1 Tax=Mycena maculata TaxID=230809 RepID=A0AAD7HCV9_9AGAR|nr:hypothetical protein DFH07DRAFT_860944 [Mycena maculata]
MLSSVDVSLQSQEDADMAQWFDFHKADEETVSLWPLDDEPLLWFDEADIKPPAELWDKDPTTFSLLWRQNSARPIRIAGPHITTNLFGRTAAEVFADFPTDFSDSPSPPSSPSLSPVSPVFPPAATGEENHGQPPTIDPLIDEVTEKLSERVHIDSPPQSPRPVSTPEPHIPNDDTAPPPLSPSTCNPSSVNSLLDTFSFSSSSSTLSVGTSSNTPSTYAVSPSPKPFSTSSRSSPALGLRSSPRRSSPPTVFGIPELGVEYRESPVGNSTRDFDVTIPPLNQIVLEEHPMDVARSRRGGSSPEAAEDLAMDGIDPRPREKAVKAARKRHPCPVPGCTELFTRPNDVLRHIKNAAIHKGTVQQAEALAAANSTLCKYCGEELSRADAARRHELKSSCGKRTIRRKSTYSMLPAF